MKVCIVTVCFLLSQFSLLDATPKHYIIATKDASPMAHEEGTDYGIGKEPDHMEKLSKIDEKQLDKLSKALQKPFLDKIKKKLGKIDEEKFDQFIETLKSRVEEAKSANGDYVAVVDQDFLDNVEKDVKMHSRKEKESKAGKNAVGSDYGIPVIVTQDYFNNGH